MRVERLPSTRTATEVADAAIVRARTAGTLSLIVVLALLALAAKAARADELEIGLTCDSSLATATTATATTTSANVNPTPGFAPAVAPAVAPAAAPAEAAAAAPAAIPAAAPAKDDVSISGSIQTRATIKGGPGNDSLSARLGLEWLAHRWSGGFSLEASNDRGSSPLFGRDGVGSIDLTERWVEWTSHGSRLDLRLGTARGVTFGQGLVLGSPTFDGLQAIAQVAEHQRLIVLAGETDSLDPDDLVDRDIGLFPSGDDLGNDGRLVGLRDEITRGASLVGFNLLHAQADGGDTAHLASADWAFQRGIVDFASEVAVRDHGGWGAFARTSVTPSQSFGVTIEGRRYSHFKSPLDAAPRYEGLSSSDEQDETGAVVRFDFAPTDRFSGSASYDWSRGGDSGPGKPNLRRDARLTLRWALTDRSSLSYGFELEDLPDARDGRVHSLLFTQSFEKWGRLSARFSFDRATADPRDSLRISWRCPLRGRRTTLLLDATIRREESLKKEFQAGASFRLGSSSFLTLRGTLTDDDTESVDVTWYRRF
jgi:hypothetical protein